jgi:hypothetical protein
MGDPTSAIVDPTPLPIAAPTLERFVSAVEASEGVALSRLAPIDQLRVRTRNSVYEITILGGGQVMVRGGSFFPDWSATSLSGSTLAGSSLKMDWIGRGFSMEFLHHGHRITTTRVREIRRIVPSITPAG